MEDRLNETIGVLTRRQVEARLVAPLVEALATEFGRDKVLRVIRNAVVEIARRQGRDLSRAMGGNSLRHFRDSLVHWTRDDALSIELIEESGQAFAFNVTRCRYAELYRALGIVDVGALLSCNRDFSLIEGFNPDIELTRTQTIMQGASHCDFRFKLKNPAAS